MSNILRFMLVSILTISIFLFGFAFAGVEQESIDLARISNILDAVYPLIDDAQTQAQKNTRVKFRYDWLREDIQSIQAGIAQKINSKEIEPRVVKPLNIKYVDQQNRHK